MTEQTVNVNPDGSTSFEDGSGDTEGDYSSENNFEDETVNEAVKGIDPAIYLLVAIILGAFIYFLYTRKSRSDDDEYFSNYGKVRALHKIGKTNVTIEFVVSLEHCF